MARVLTPRAEDFPRWYQDLIAKAKLADNAESYLKREAEHVEGFSPELAVVTHGGGTQLAEPVESTLRRSAGSPSGPGTSSGRTRSTCSPCGTASPTWCGRRTTPGWAINVGTDAGGGMDDGLAAREMLLLHERAGMSAVNVLAAASWGAPDWLGFPGLTEGGLADLVVYDADPRTDLRVVQQPRRIVLSGRVIR